ncbi:MAG TPA: hypothetical protein P5572_02295 [Phycisphaerae bacterium]|nr:hypothetical protein [Phycisphaerae bacterium]
MQVFGAALFAAALTGCPAPTQTTTPPVEQTRSDLLRARYPDLTSGRFAVVADFEDPAQFELFHVEGEGAAVDDLTTSQAGVQNTGGQCLAMRFAAPTAKLVANNTTAHSWLLKRDWRDYTLLLMNVFSQSDNVRLYVELVGGDDERTKTTRANWNLIAGWNLLRLDLGEAGQFVPLDEIREIRWSVEPGPNPVLLRFDDILLTDNRKTVFGSPDGAEGSLYVQHAGRRISVGAVGRFELGLANGQIVRWYALATDPARLRDLVGVGNALGPMPVRLPPGADWRQETDWRWLLGGAGAETVVGAQQRLMEANAVRAVVECTWSLSAGDHTVELARWLYVIYPSGQVYATVVCGSAAGDNNAGDIGLAVSRKPQEFLTAEVHAPGRLGDLPALANRSYACLSTGDAGTGLFFMLNDSACGPQLQAVMSPDAPRYSVVSYGGGRDCPANPWSALLGVGPAGDCRPATSAACARAYGATDAIDLLVGDYRRDTVGDADGDGFNERFGSFMLKPEAGRVQLRLHAQSTPIMSPAFSVEVGDAGEAWVYVDNLIHAPVARDPHGNLVFQVPGLCDHDMLVEVYLREPTR